MKEVKAILLGFHAGRRIKPGTKFWVKDDFKRKWVVDVKKEVPVAPTASEANRESTDDPNDLI